MSQDIFVVIEHLRGNVADISYVMLAAARNLAQWSGGEVVGVLLGNDAQTLSNIRIWLNSPRMLTKKR